MEANGLDANHRYLKSVTVADSNLDFTTNPFSPAATSRGSPRLRIKVPRIFDLRRRSTAPSARR